MSAMKRLREAKDGQNDRSKATKTSSSLLSRLNHMDGKATTGEASWDNVSDSLICWLVRKVSSEGGLVTFGTTRDGGALKVSIWDGGQKHDEYFGAQADLSMAVWSFCLRLCSEEEVGPSEP